MNQMLQRMRRSREHALRAARTRQSSVASTKLLGINLDGVKFGVEHIGHRLMVGQGYLLGVAMPNNTRDGTSSIVRLLLCDNDDNFFILNVYCKKEKDSQAEKKDDSDDENNLTHHHGLVTKKHDTTNKLTL